MLYASAPGLVYALGLATAPARRRTLLGVTLLLATIVLNVVVLSVATSNLGCTDARC